jgi:hypothetical protein
MAINTFVPPDITNSTLWPEPTNAATNYRNQSTAQFTSVTNQLNTEVRDKINTHLAETVAHTTVVTRDLSIDGVQAVTGFGFTPKLVFIMAVVDAVKGKMSLGQATATRQTALRDVSLDVDDSFQYVNSVTINITDGSGNSTSGVVAFTADGINVTWAKAGTGATGTANVLITAMSHY